MNITRTITSQIQDNLYRQRVIVIYGARRTGKTTIVNELLSSQKPEVRTKYINCDNLNDKQSLESDNLEQVKAFLGDYDLIALDEAQNVNRIGHLLKLLVDTYPELQIIATGSSSFDLANQIGEPLVGRKYTYLLYPLSLVEITKYKDLSYSKSKLESLLRFGCMPSVFGKSENEAIAELNLITSDYLYKDILLFEGIKKSRVIQNLLKAVAFQVGNEVSYREIGQLIGVSHVTVARYLDLLEKCHIIFSLSSLARNPRNELKQAQKFYFYDLGVRNALIQNFNNLDTRNDIGALWENFCILERMKLQQSRIVYYNPYFWRTTTQKEIDYIEEYGGVLNTFEFKWSPKKQATIPALFNEYYPNNTFTLINNDNWWRYLI
jgi:uncharacterized protein